MAANGMCQRRETGAMIMPTTRHATIAPVAALEPKRGKREPPESVGPCAGRHRPGEHIQRRGKENAITSDCHACSDDVTPKRHGPAAEVPR
jgi:hypothetical protein